MSTTMEPNKRKRAQVIKGKSGGMLLVLTQDVLHVGKQGEVVEVRHGYGRNFLCPGALQLRLPNITCASLTDSKSNFSKHEMLVTPILKLWLSKLFALVV